MAADTEVIGQITQKMDYPSRTKYFGKGKLDELKQLKDELEYDTVVVLSLIHI